MVNESSSCSCSCPCLLPPAPAFCLLLLPPASCILSPDFLAFPLPPSLYFCTRITRLPCRSSFPHGSSPSQTSIPWRLAMKRCSQCHFTFSDDEQFCDFDHT